MLSQDLKLDGLAENLFKLKNIVFNLQLKEIQSQNPAIFVEIQL